MSVERSVPVDALDAPSLALDDPGLYINRELSWLQFNDRVLEEALDQSQPLLERVKFLSIVGSNLDEFFMIRVSGLRHQLEGGALEAPPDAMTPAEQLAAIRLRLQPHLEQQIACWKEELVPLLREAGIWVLGLSELKKRQRKLLRRYFEAEIFPTLTPLAFDPSHPFPHISNLSLNLAVVVGDPKLGERFARVKVPATLPRLLRIPSEDRADDFEGLGLAGVAANNFVWIEEVVADNLGLLFPGLEIIDAYPFRVTRDADVEIEEDEAADLLSTVEQGVGARHFGTAVRLEVDPQTPEHIREILVANLELAPYQVFALDGPVGLADVIEITSVDQPELKDPPFQQALPPSLATEENVFSRIKRQDILLYHPYQSFSPVVDFVRAAARDPQVLAIKQTLYRIGPNSPIVEALLEARRNDKQVAVMVELKARFDEENNIEWARALEHAGVHVVYGVAGLKTHAKVLLVVRREPEGIQRYVHLSTGNYNVGTSRLYTDLGFFTADPQIGADASDLFNVITGYARKDSYQKLLVAPTGLREEIVGRIDREIQIHEAQGGGRLVFKMNALVDRECIEALYEASQAGVQVDLQVRGICCLRPAVPGVSDNIRVTSVVGRFLEHARIYYFGNGGDEEVFLGSADLMPRNLNRRVETLFPIESEELRRLVVEDILATHLADNQRARLLLADGSYERLAPASGEESVDSQLAMLERGGGAVEPAAG